MPQTLTVATPRPGVTVVRLDRAERLNAINEVMVSELMHACADLGADPQVKVVVLTGAGRGFCSGIDLRDFGPGMLDATAPAIDRLRFQEAMGELPQAVRAMPQPVIAAVNGACVGAGLALFLGADIRICSSAASFGNVSAEEAERRGLVSETVEPGGLIDRALELASLIADLAPLGVQLTKRALQVNTDAPGLASAIELENRNQVLTHATDEAAARRRKWTT
jgi:enoyl-CoA hydratase/carnithine racemase